jgi:hypothetical protein
MPETTIIVFDVETMPDLSTAARMLGLGAAADACRPVSYKDRGKQSRCNVTSLRP